MSSEDNNIIFEIVLALIVYGTVGTLYLKNKKSDPRAFQKNNIPKKYTYGQLWIKTFKFCMMLLVIIACIALLVFAFVR